MIQLKNISSSLEPSPLVVTPTIVDINHNIRQVQETDPQSSETRTVWQYDVDRFESVTEYLALQNEAKKEQITELSVVMATIQAATEVAFVVLANSGQIDDVTISEHPHVFVEWDENWRGLQGDIIREDCALYRSIHNVSDAGQNTRPSTNPAMWTKIGDPCEEFPDWSQPLGAHDAYSAGAKVTHKEKKWLNTHGDGNIWEPGVFGWTEQKEAK